jgi:hypothetical protein
MSETDLDVLEGQINDYKRIDDIFKQGKVIQMIETLNIIKDKLLPEDEDLFISVRDKLHKIAYPPIPLVEIPPPLNPVNIKPLLIEIQNL